MYKMIIITIV